MGAAETSGISAPELRVRNCVVFDWSEATVGSPPGLEIAVFVRRALRAYIDANADALRQHGDEGWEFTMGQSNWADLVAVVQRVDSWRVTLRPEPLGKKGRPWPPRRKIEGGVFTASRAIHAFLAADSSFSNVRWYTERELADRRENPTAGGPEPGRV